MVRPLTSREGPTGEGFTFVNNQRTITVNNINHFTQLSADFLQSVSQWLRDPQDARRHAMFECGELSGPMTDVDPTALPLEEDVYDDDEFLDEDEQHVLIHERSSGDFLRSCTMTTSALREAVLTGTADTWNVVHYDLDASEGTIICPRCAVGLSCQGSVF